MTHEHKPSSEAAKGPEHDVSLPAAESIPGDLSAGDSDGPPLEED